MIVTSRSRPSLGVFGQSPYRLLWAAYTGSTIGDGLYAVTLVWLVIRTAAERSQALTLLGLAETTPLLILGIVGGVIADRSDQRRLMVAADVARGAAVCGLALLVLIDRTSLVAILLCAVTLATMNLLFSPAHRAVLPAVVPAEQMASANAFLSFSTQTAALLAPAAAALLFGLIEPQGVLAIDAFSFLWSALLLSRVRIQRSPMVRPRRRMLDEVGEGVGFVRSEPRVRTLIALGVLNQLFASGPYTIAVPLWVASRPEGGVVAYGLLLSALAAGMLAGSLVVGVFGLRGRLAEIVALGILGDGVFFAVAALAPTLVVSMLLFSALGLSFSVLGAALNAEIQRSVPRELLGRTFATTGVLSNIATPVSLTVSGALLAVIAPSTLIIGSGLALSAVGLVGFAAVRRGIEPGLRPAARVQGEIASS